MKYGLLGENLIYSFSREIHQALGEYEYNLYTIPGAKLRDFVDSFDFGGLNVTIPYKQDVISLCDEVTPLAREIGAVNSLYRRGADLIGHNTDYEGFIYMAERSKIDFKGSRVLILGSGGTSLMAEKACADMGAEEITVVSRRLSHTHRTITYDSLDIIEKSVDIIINTTPVGTFPDNGRCVISLERFTSCCAVLDVIYNPFKTKLILDAERMGLKYSGGLPMLVAQATASAGYFLDMPGAFKSENDRLIKDIESKKKNLVLIGMPGSGKTTLGKMLSHKTGRKFIDTDREIEAQEGMTIGEIFRVKDEKGFRQIEREFIASIGKDHGLVIATGGGMVLDPRNIDNLRQNGFMIYISRPLKNLATEGRPLSSDIDALKKIAGERCQLYMAAADITFDNRLELDGDELREAFYRALRF